MVIWTSWRRIPPPDSAGAVPTQEQARRRWRWRWRRWRRRRAAADEEGIGASGGDVTRGGQDFTDVLRRTINILDTKNTESDVTRGWPRYCRCLKKNHQYLGQKKMIESDATNPNNSRQ